jgi:hypothetical protein
MNLELALITLYEKVNKAANKHHNWRESLRNSISSRIRMQNKIIHLSTQSVQPERSLCYTKEINFTP